MNKIYLFLASMLIAGSFLTSCSDWNDDESLKIKTPQHPQQDAYLKDLRDYKKTDHKAVYVWFDNSTKVPSSRAHHMSDVPDSTDVVVVTNPADLASFELADIKYLQDVKGTKVAYCIDFDAIQKVYVDMVRDEFEKNEEYVPQVFSEYLTQKVNALLSLSPQYDGLIAGYFGQSTVYMSDNEKEEYLSHQKVFFDLIGSWITANPSKMFTFLGNPQFINDKSILLKSKHIILNTLEVDAVEKLGLAALQSSVEEVPTDRYVFFVNTVSLDASDKLTGFYGNTPALLPAANWITQGGQMYTKAGLAINNVQTDYYKAEKRYQTVREAIGIINVAP